MEQDIEREEYIEGRRKGYVENLKATPKFVDDGDHIQQVYWREYGEIMFDRQNKLYKDTGKYIEKVADKDIDYSTPFITGHGIITPQGQCIHCDRLDHNKIARNILKEKHYDIYEKTSLRREDYCDQLLKLGYVHIEYVRNIQIQSRLYRTLEELPQAILNYLYGNYLEVIELTGRDARITEDNFDCIMIIKEETDNGIL